jgi:hypothetical protein
MILLGSDPDYIHDIAQVPNGATLYILHKTIQKL